MAVIALINQKGGCGKSTSSVHLAYWLQFKQNYRVLLIDADAQKSSSQWVEGMENPIPCQVIQSPDDLLEQIPELVKDYDYLIVDGPASLAEETRAILFRCDLAVIPVQPTGVDLRSASDAMRLLKQAQSVRGGLPKGLVFLSRAVKNTKLKDEAIALLSQIPDAKFLKPIIHQKQAVADTSGQSLTVWDLPGQAANEAATEYERLFKAILKQLEGA
ncbi:Protein ParA (plasmid) [Planktothrix tepida]|uniref:Cobyrinic acid ac-diamide synthase n=1 Tax=Planktothrix tepida PCC 9214 TaxID=671072 RepID=A0A1J1LPT9_9CYAN|nr:AAA family ATPase [Planktothrix tepida]CAD5988379.1 Protein ParA [Planktothrix tepida]CUR33932.1 Cobyrinic acid ac-diamide synthase [Planktothrix tepida PCC 9214]